jgi:hypothetical protein
VIEYLGDMPTEYLRIEMKTVPDREHRDMRMAPEDTAPIEDAQVRISRQRCPPNSTCAMPIGPSLVVEPANRSFTWMNPGERQKSGTANVASSQIWIELKTQTNPE